MSGETDLPTLIASMRPTLDPHTYVFATAPWPPDSRALADLLVDASALRMVFFEAEGATLVLRHDAAEGLGIDWAFASRMITLNVHSALNAVGFLAAVTRALADEGLGANAVSAYYHDHLFVAVDHADKATAALERLAAG